MSDHKGYKIRKGDGAKIHYVLNNDNKTLCGKWIRGLTVSRMREDVPVSCKTCLKWDVAKENWR